MRIVTGREIAAVTLPGLRGQWVVTPRPAEPSSEPRIIRIVGRGRTQDGSFTGRGRFVDILV